MNSPIFVCNKLLVNSYMQLVNILKITRNETYCTSSVCQTCICLVYKYRYIHMMVFLYSPSTYSRSVYTCIFLGGGGLSKERYTNRIVVLYLPRIRPIAQSRSLCAHDISAPTVSFITAKHSTSISCQNKAPKSATKCQTQLQM